MKNFLSGVIIVFLSIYCSVSIAIINGKLVPPSSPVAQSTVLLYLNGSSCSGAIIGPDLILTAAHCVYDLLEESIESQKNFKVIFGNYEPDKELPPIRSVVAVELADYNPAAKEIDNLSDIAILKIDGHIATGFRPVRILDGTSYNKGGIRNIIAGYGNLYPINDPLEPNSRILRQYNYTVSSETSSTGMLIYNRERGGMAAGDSGGPAFVDINGELFLVGVASGYYLRNSSPDEKFPIYESVPRFADWIRQAAKKLNSELP